MGGFSNKVDDRGSTSVKHRHSKTLTFLIYCVAYLSGAVFLGLEIVASRVVAPYFGNSIYVWGSLISVFLLALSIGYYLGGILADRRPSFKVLSVVIIAAGIFVLLVPFIQEPIGLLVSGFDWDLRLAVLLAVSAYFLLPSILMGMVSPYIVKLKTTELAALGQSAGNVYAVSTLGSISGAFLVSFVLITSFGTRAILLGSGFTLIFIALLCLPCAQLAGQWRVAGSGDPVSEK
ncbi:MAG: fused MFS/spermidine synthase [Gammaproteobacteria bacterium]